MSPWNGPDSDFLGFSRTWLKYDERKHFPQGIRTEYKQDAGLISPRDQDGIARPRMKYTGEVAMWTIPLWPVFVLGAAYFGMRIAGVVRRRRRIAGGRGAAAQHHG
jgi:hypothetical protein